MISPSGPASLHFPFQFDEDLLLADFKTCSQYKFLPNYIKENYSGDDYILPLRSLDGRIDFALAVPDDNGRYADTEALTHCPYFKKVIDQFKCEKEAVRLMNLPPGAGLNTHIDEGCGYDEGLFRVHIPITTNDDVEFILNGERINMGVGQAWYTNVKLPHSVFNKGESDRVHLVLDCKRNEWSDQLFAEHGHEVAWASTQEEELSQDTIRLMIGELEKQNNPAIAQMIADLKQQLI